MARVSGVRAGRAGSVDPFEPADGEGMVVAFADREMLGRIFPPFRVGEFGEMGVAFGRRIDIRDIDPVGQRQGELVDRFAADHEDFALAFAGGATAIARRRR